MDDPYLINTTAARTVALRYIAGGIVFYLGCVTYLAFWLVSIAANVEEAYSLYYQRHITGQDSERKGAFYAVLLVVAILFQLGGAGGTVVIMWWTARMLC